MTVQREAFTSPLAVACYILIVSMAVGAVLGVFAVVPALKNKCVWFKGNCQQISYQIAPNGTLLVINPATGFMYWYDGQFIYSYGNAIQGACAQQLGTGTHQLVPIGAPIPNACLKYGQVAPGKTGCILPSQQTVTPTKFDGEIIAKGNVFEPVFVLNAYSMQVLPQKTACALSRSVVTNFFKDSPPQTLWYNIPEGGQTLDVYQLFGFLQDQGVFVPPSSDTIWYDQSSSAQT
jgi:hypothetical protein